MKVYWYIITLKELSSWFQDPWRRIARDFMLDTPIQNETGSFTHLPEFWEWLMNRSDFKILFLTPLKRVVNSPFGRCHSSTRYSVLDYSIVAYVRLDLNGWIYSRCRRIPIWIRHFPLSDRMSIQYGDVSMSMEYMVAITVFNLIRSQW